MPHTKKNTLDEVIASRTLHYTSEQGTQTLMIQLGKPKADTQAGGDWACPIQIGADVKIAFGVDSYQALSMALQLIAIEIRHLKNKQNIDLHWLGMDNLGLEPIRE